MMIRGFGLRRQAVDELDRLEKIAKRVLLADGVPLKRPAVETLDPLLRVSQR
jgi:hypothetical protein